MQISKKKIYACRIIMWGGLVLAAAGAVCYYVGSHLIDWSILLLGGGLVISFIGGVFLKRQFRCPNCKASILAADASIDLRMTNIPKSCPNCQTQVELVD